MDKSTHFSQLNRFLIGTASLGITLFAINAYGAFINTIIVALILGVVFTPFMVWMQKKKAPNWLALLLTMVAVIVIMVGLFLFFVFSLAQLSTAVPGYAAELEKITDQLFDFLESVGADNSNMQSLADLVEPDAIVAFVKDFLSDLVAILSDGVTVLLILIFLLIGASSFATKTERLIATGNPGLKRLYKFNQDIRHYIIITNNVGMAAGVINALFLSIIGVDFAILWGVLSWLLSYIPMVGFLLALIPPLVLGLLEFGWGTAVIIFVGFILINSAIDDFIKPRLMGQGLDIAPVMVFISVVFWGLILGPLGAILAVPVTVGIKQLLLEPDPDNRWMAELISGSAQEKDEVDVQNNPDSETSTA